MKLLTKKTIKTKKRDELARELILAQKVQKVSEKVRRKLNDDKSEDENERNKLSEGFEKFSVDITSKKGELVKEIDVLEERKKEALKPVTALLKQAKETLKSNQNETQKLEKREILHSKADVKMTRDQDALEKQKNASQQKVTELTERENSVIIIEAQLETNENELTSYITEQHGIISTRVQDLDDKEYNLTQKEVALNNEREALATQRVEDDNVRRQLDDQRATLERAMARIK